jgi:hypothetical protein
MSTLVFRTRSDSDENVAIAGAGFLGAGGKGAVSIEEAARNMSELQERDEYGALVLDEDGNPKPLEGAKLRKAAEAFAEDRGLVVAEMSDEKFARKGEELGQPVGRPDAREVSLAAGARDRGQIENELAKTRVALAAEADRGLASPAPEAPEEPEGEPTRGRKGGEGD